MSGDAQVRFCGKCEKNVYSLDALTVEEIRTLLLRNEGKVCWRFFVRRDGTVLTKDCPVGLQRVRMRVRASLAAAAAIFLASAAGLLREGGFWGASQSLGSLSVRAESSAVLPMPLRAAQGSQHRETKGDSAVRPQEFLGDSMVREKDDQ